MPGGAGSEATYDLPKDGVGSHRGTADPSLRTFLATISADEIEELDFVERIEREDAAPDRSGDKVRHVPVGAGDEALAAEVPDELVHLAGECRIVGLVPDDDGSMLHVVDSLFRQERFAQETVGALTVPEVIAGSRWDPNRCPLNEEVLVVDVRRVMPTAECADRYAQAGAAVLQQYDDEDYEGDRDGAARCVENIPILPSLAGIQAALPGGLRALRPLAAPLALFHPHW
jgi:hypothetical protein